MLQALPGHFLGLAAASKVSGRCHIDHIIFKIPLFPTIDIVFFSMRAVRLSHLSTIGSLHLSRKHYMGNISSLNREVPISSAEVCIEAVDLVAVFRVPKEGHYGAM